MSGIQKDLGPKGLEVLEAAVNENADLASFQQQFKPPFPVGTISAATALEYIQWPRDKRPLVPFMVFIDRKGVIRAQYTGADSDFFDESKMDQHIRAEIEKLLSEPAGPATPKSHRKAK
ncbi:MAG TPA: hypothetical protein VMH80_07265 [Bryobacteraceae bacterium]|nr:hypothetical protein [Bryobacteraceae bacterium]